MVVFNRKEFRVCVISQLPLESIQEYLFGHTTAPAGQSRATEPTSTVGSAPANTHTLMQSSGKAGTNEVTGVSAQSQDSVRAMLPALEHFKVVSIGQEQEPVAAAEN